MTDVLILKLNYQFDKLGPFHTQIGRRNLIFNRLTVFFMNWAISC